ncbi:MAG TPA: gamma-glutamyltransferase family protein [Mesotoga sp.]|jgi:gamma-glutamyltranspeptidase/glutathione hydrolase|nr:gamma-glutamyltransferase family protein [Mesotoga sp.]MDI9375444.1 gamma-glutamyltransferase family protein [Thermotogota bacterium]HPB63680.1 gamma-glutamyltransferase family protein [Mesotoga sp.]HPX21893.1 gamma-glutamyltransferase family protein [Mesotoga sp.]HQC55886.1 gamma-glutamyltransferase family protein [Mesotoga sp.]
MKRIVLTFFCLLLLVGIGFSVITASVGKLQASNTGMVAAGNPYAAAAGAEILEKGGNAIDAAIAVSLALGVVEPYASGIGGEGYAVVSFNGEKIAVDFRSSAPGLASIATAAELGLKASDFRTGPLSICTPGVLAGIIELWLYGGSLPFAELIAPAIRLASEGFEVNYTFASSCGGSYDVLLENAPGFLKEGLFAWEAGDIATNPELAETYKYLAENGPQAFYNGTLADKIDALMQSRGGLLRKSDLVNYRALVKTPLHGTYREYDLFVPGIPVGGPYLLETLNILEHFNLSAFAWDDPLVMNIINQALTFAMIDLLSYSGDPAYVYVPVETLISKEYSKTRFMNIDLNQALDSALYYTDYIGKPHLFEDTDSYVEALLAEAGVIELVPSTADVGQDTTHFAVIDRNGNAVAWTQTLSGFFGSGVYLDGFFINNEMGNFTLDETSRGLVPGKRPVTTICPTIIEKDGKVVYLIGTPGGYYIQSTITNVIVDLIDFGMTLDEAQMTPKLIGSPNYPEFRMETGFPESSRLFLEKIMGHKVREFQFPYRSFGSLNLIQVQPDGLMIGIGAFRREGGASAPEF